jgi:cholesterol transport system auxiliary component
MPAGALTRRLLAVAALALMAGCATPDSQSPHRYFVLAEVAPAASAPVHEGARAPILRVATVTSASFYDTPEIVYSRAPGTRAYYRFSSWTEPPAQAIGPALIARLRSSGSFAAVVPASSGVEGGLLLRVHLDQLYHDDAVQPGTARIELHALLTDTEQRRLLGERSFSAARPVETNDADGAVRGLRLALDDVLRELTAWLATQAGR